MSKTTRTSAPTATESNPAPQTAASNRERIAALRESEKKQRSAEVAAAPPAAKRKRTAQKPAAATPAPKQAKKPAGKKPAAKSATADRAAIAKAWRNGQTIAQLVVTFGMNRPAIRRAITAEVGGRDAFRKLRGAGAGGSTAKPTPAAKSKKPAAKPAAKQGRGKQPAAQPAAKKRRAS